MGYCASDRARALSDGLREERGGNGLGMGARHGLADQLRERQQVKCAQGTDRADRDNREGTYIRNCDRARVTAGCVGNAAPLVEDVEGIELQALCDYHISILPQKLL